MQNLQAGIRDQPPATEAPAPAARAPRKKKEVVEHIEPESDSDSTSDSGSESDYEEVNKIKSYFEQEPCEAISPAALGQTKTKKEALAYLKSKNCPKIPNIKRSAKSIKMESGPASPAPEVATKKRVAKPKAAAAPVPAATVPAAPEPATAPVAEVKVVKKRTPKVKAPEAAAPAAAPSQGTPLASAPTAPEKKKRAPSAYASLVGKLVKEKKMSFAEAAKAAKAELDAKKKKD